MPRPFIPIPNTVKVEMRYTCFGQKMENVFYFSGPNPVTLADAGILGAQLVTWATDNLLAHLASVVSLNSIKFTDMSEIDGFTLEYTTGLPVTGVGAGNPLPLNVTAAVRLGTAKRGKSFTGRNYLPSIMDAYVNGNSITTAGIGLFKSAYEALRDMSSPGDSLAKLAVASFRFANAWRAIGVATPVTSVAVDGNLDSQRRRLTGRGQ